MALYSVAFYKMAVEYYLLLLRPEISCTNSYSIQLFLLCVVGVIFNWTLTFMNFMAGYFLNILHGCYKHLLHIDSTIKYAPVV